MKGKLIIIQNKNIKKTTYYLEKLDYGKEDYLIEISIPENISFDFNKIKIGFYNFLNRKLKSKAYCETFYTNINLIKETLSKNLDLIDSCNLIILKNHTKSMIDHIENNINSDNKKILLEQETYDISDKTYEKINKTIGNYKNIYINTEGNKSRISIEEYVKTNKILSPIIKKTKSLNLSPIEEAMYIYDIVRDRKYVSEEENEEDTVSRDLTKVLLGNKIVCVGFAEIYCNLLNQLNIEASIYVVRMLEGGKHAKVIAHIIDDKYNVNGIYAFDPTWDCKYDNTNDFLMNYQYFATHKDYGPLYDISFGYQQQNIDSNEIEKGFVKDIKESVDKNENTDKDKINNLYNIYQFIEKHKIKKKNDTFESEMFIKETSLNKLKKNYNEFIKLINKDISIYDLANIIYSVRKIEYYQEPDKFELSNKVIINTINNDIKYDYKNEEIDREIEQVRLTKVLSNIRNKKTL